MHCRQVIDATTFFFEKGLNTEVRNNYIEVKKRVTGNVSNMKQGGNEGTFQLDNIDGIGTTTEAHEFGHSLGLWPGTPDGHPKERDLRSKGQPGIMYTRGTAVDAKYTYKPSSGNTKYDPKTGQHINSIDPNKRKVLQSDIDALGLDKLKYDESGKAKHGKSSSHW